MMKRFTLYILITISFVTSIFGQELIPADSLVTEKVKQDSSTKSIPPEALEKVQLMDFKNQEIKDVFRGLAKKYNINIFIEDDINQRITIRLSSITVDEAIRFIAKEYDLELILERNIYKIYQPDIEIPEQEPEPIRVLFENNLLTVDLKNEDIVSAIRAIAETSGKNILLERGVTGEVSGFLTNIPFEEGLKTLLKSNGYAVRKKEDIYLIEYDYLPSQDNNKQQGKHFWVDVRKDSLITLDVVNGDLNRIIRETASRLGVDVFSYGTLKGEVNAQCSGITFDEVLDYLFKGTNYTYRKEGKIYFVGDKNISGIASIRLIRLNHIKVEGIIEMLPASITSKATLKIIKEHNAIMVVGAQDVIRETEEFVSKIDYPIPQILIEALVIDFVETSESDWGISAWLSQDSDSAKYEKRLFPDINITTSGNVLNEQIDLVAPQFGIKNIGKLPSNFMLNLRALVKDGKVNVRSQPQIATLNGHPASIKIGTTQYYKFQSERPIVGGNQAFNQISQRFEKITAEMSLTITPWVSASGEITTEIKPEFSTPRKFDPDVPPTIDHRIIESTVRLRDGETIVLGGMIQTDITENVSKLPVLGDIPLLGKLFQNRYKKNQKTKMMIYITPHLTYSEETQINPGVIE